MYNFSEVKENFKKVEEWLAKEYASVHTGRATPMILDNINIEVYGAFQPIKNVGSINIEDPKTIRIVPWDKTHIKSIEKAIYDADLGLSVAPDDMGIRVIFPMLTTETRTKLVKVLKEKMEDARITVRKERENEIDKIKEASLPKDDDFRVHEELQKIVNEANLKLEEIFNKKENEVMN